LRRHFSVVAQRFYELARSLPALYTERGQGKWVPCEDAVLMGLDPPPTGGLLAPDARCGDESRLDRQLGACFSS
jgi:hypothetical protein